MLGSGTSRRTRITGLSRSRTHRDEENLNYVHQNGTSLFFRFTILLILFGIIAWVATFLAFQLFGDLNIKRALDKKDFVDGVKFQDYNVFYKSGNDDNQSTTILPNNYNSRNAATKLINEMDKFASAIQAVALEERRLVKNLTAGGINPSYVSYLNDGVTRMHGIVGRENNGTPGWIPNPPTDTSHQDMKQVLKQGGGFNLILSDSLPLDRNVIDSRATECREPILSVIIVFYNEPFSTLFRSVHSVLNRTPPSILKEILLVDDGSNARWIQKNGTGLLDHYASLLPKTRVLRNRVRQGIVSARMLGIRNAKGEIFCILDSHIEVNVGWAEPLVARIHEDSRRVVMPSVASLSAKTFVPSLGGIGCTLGFLWKLIEHGYDSNEHSPKDRQSRRPQDYITSPTMAGGLFAANKDFFLHELGGYDEKFMFWGTENLEISFRIWMCGGVLECTQCSIVYHIFRSGGVGYDSPEDSTTKNKMRLLKGWMDEFGDLAWRVMGQPDVDYGSVENVLEFRKAKQCKSFKWYLDTIYPEAEVKSIPDDVPYLGPLLNQGSKYCLAHDIMPEDPVLLEPCTGEIDQDWMYFKNSRHWMPVLNDESCLGHNLDMHITSWCQNDQSTWNYNETTKLLTYQQNNECLRANNITNSLEMILSLAPCNPNDVFQKWDVTRYTLT